MVVYAAEDLQFRAQAYDLLALAAREEWGMSPLTEIIRSSGGKPRFSTQSGREFNLSHSGPMALCALDSAPVGADIQQIKECRIGLPAKVCSPRELEWLEAQPVLWAAFATLWTLKESRVKQSGQGLTRPISAIAVPLPEPGRSLLQLDGLWFRMYSGRGWAAAVCGVNAPPEQLLWKTLVPQPSERSDASCSPT